MKDYLLSIGELSNITGVHISSLRYYDKLGVLPPAYIDPDTNYRYYTYSQVEIVSAIQTCIALDIPLKEYQHFTVNNGQTIHAEELLTYGKEQAKKKLRTIRNGIKKIEQYQQQIVHSKELLCSDKPLKYHAHKKNYYTIPLNHSLTENDYKNIDRFPLLVEGKGYQLGSEYGLIYFYKTTGIERYQFVEITTRKSLKDKNIISLPEGDFWAKTAEADKIENAATEFPDLFTTGNTQIVVLTGLFTENIDVNHLLYELRCYSYSPKYQY